MIKLKSLKPRKNNILTKANKIKKHEDVVAKTATEATCIVRTKKIQKVQDKETQVAGNQFIDKVSCFASVKT